MDSSIIKIVNKALDGNILGDAEVKALFELEDFSDEAAVVRAASFRFSRDTFKVAECASQVGLDNLKCPANCVFCSFSASNSVFDETGKMPHDEVVERAGWIHDSGATAVYLMTTVSYPFEELVEVCKKVREKVGPDYPVVVNTMDMDLDMAKALAEAGVSGAYHVIRMGEERDNRLKVADRWKTINAIKDAGMFLTTCVEPIGPEHTVDELVEKTVWSREMGAVHSGAMRRSVIPGSGLEHYGMISFMRLANIAAVINLSTGPNVALEVHNPNLLGAAAGGNVFYAEVGANPRDTDAETEGSEGLTVPKCLEMFEEAGCTVNTGPTKIFCHH